MFDRSEIVKDARICIYPEANRYYSYLEHQVNMISLLQGSKELLSAFLSGEENDEVKRVALDLEKLESVYLFDSCDSDLPLSKSMKDLPLLGDLIESLSSLDPPDERDLVKVYIGFIRRHSLRLTSL